MSSRSASVLPLVLVVLCVVGIVGFALLGRGWRAGSMAAWARERTAMRTLAESAIQELWLDLQRKANQPDRAAFATLRQLKAGGATVPVPGLTLAAVPAELDRQSAALGGKLQLTCGAFVRQVAAASGDPMDTTGIVVLEAGVQLAGGLRPGVSARVRVEHAFRTTAVTPGRALDRAALVVMRTGASDLKQFGGRSAVASGGAPGHSLVELMTHTGADGFQPVAGAAASALNAAVRALEPGRLADRAQRHARTVAELKRLLGEAARPGGLNGVVWVSAPDFTSLELPRFRGKCVLGFRGPVEVKDVTLDDPRRDSLTIVSAEGLVVAGRQLQASLVCTKDAADAVTFRERASITGTVVCGRFPRRVTLPPQEFGECRFAAAPDVDLMSRYLVALSPYPIAVQHASDREEWQAW